MSTQSIIDISSGEFADMVDEAIACKSKNYLRYENYKVGSKDGGVDMKEMLKIGRMRHIAFDDTCALSDRDRMKIKEKLNKMIS